MHSVNMRMGRRPAAKPRCCSSGYVKCRPVVPARPVPRRQAPAVRANAQQNDQEAGFYLPLRIMSNVSGFLVTLCPPSCAMAEVAQQQQPADFASSAYSEMTYMPMASSGLAMEDRYLQAAIEAGNTAFDQALLSICDVTDMLSSATGDFLDIQAGISGQPTADVAVRMSQQAMAVASEALNLATIMEAGAHGAEERALVAQIEEAARHVSFIARDIAGQPLQLPLIEVGAAQDAAQ